MSKIEITPEFVKDAQALKEQMAQSETSIKAKGYEDYKIYDKRIAKLSEQNAFTEVYTRKLIAYLIQAKEMQYVGEGKPRGIEGAWHIISDEEKEQERQRRLQEQLEHTKRVLIERNCTTEDKLNTIDNEKLLMTSQAIALAFNMDIDTCLKSFFFANKDNDSFRIKQIVNAYKEYSHSNRLTYNDVKQVLSTFAPHLRYLDENEDYSKQSREHIEREIELSQSDFKPFESESRAKYLGAVEYEVERAVRAIWGVKATMESRIEDYTERYAKTEQGDYQFDEDDIDKILRATKRGILRLDEKDVIDVLVMKTMRIACGKLKGEYSEMEVAA